MRGTTLMSEEIGRYTVRLAELERDWDALSWLRTGVEARLMQMQEAGQALGTDLARGLDRMAYYTGTDQMYVTIDCGTLVACHALTPDGDPAFWSAAERAEEGLYLDNAMVRPDRVHQGLGAVITQHAIREARARRMTVLRLDCERGNQRLLAHWTDLGFTWVRDIQVPGRASGTLMEMKL